MKRNLITLIVMEGVNLFFIGLLYLFGITFVPRLSEIQPLFIAMVVSLFIGIGCVWFTYIYSIVHVCKNNELSSKERTTNLILIIIFSVFYAPIYYTKYVIKDKKWWGILNCVIYSVLYLIIFGGLLIGIVYTLDEPAGEMMEVVTKDNLLSVELTNNYTCKSEDMGGYELYCSNNYKAEIFGIFNYDFTYDSEYILEFHTNQLVDTYKKEGMNIVSEQTDNLIRKVEMSLDGVSYYITMEVKEFNKSLKSVLVHVGEEKEKYNKIVSSIKYNV